MTRDYWTPGALEAEARGLIDDIGGDKTPEALAAVMEWRWWCEWRAEAEVLRRIRKAIRALDDLTVGGDDLIARREALACVRAPRRKR